MKEVGNIMWDETLIESRRNRSGKRQWITVALSVSFHTILVAIIITASYWYLEAVTPVRPNQAIYQDMGLPKDDVIHVAIKQGTPKGNDIPARPENQTTFMQPKDLSQEQVNPDSDLTDGETPVARTPFDLGEGVPGGLGPKGSENGNSEIGAMGPGGDADQPIVIHTGVVAPVLTLRVQPEYPDIMRQAHVQGVVILNAVISKTGDVEVREVLKSVHPILDREAVRAVNQWKYKPATVNGNPVAVWFTVTVSYRLR